MSTQDAKASSRRSQSARCRTPETGRTPAAGEGADARTIDAHQAEVPRTAPNTDPIPGLYLDYVEQFRAWQQVYDDTLTADDPARLAEVRVMAEAYMERARARLQRAIPRSRPGLLVLLHHALALSDDSDVVQTLTSCIRSLREHHVGIVDDPTTAEYGDRADAILDDAVLAGLSGEW